MHLAEPPAGTGNKLGSPCACVQRWKRQKKGASLGRLGTTPPLPSWRQVSFLSCTSFSSARTPSISFQADDWSLVPLVHAALHGGLSPGSALAAAQRITSPCGQCDRRPLRLHRPARRSRHHLLQCRVFIAAYVCLLMLARIPANAGPHADHRRHHRGALVQFGRHPEHLVGVPGVLVPDGVLLRRNALFVAGAPERRRVLWFAAAAVGCRLFAVHRPGVHQLADRCHLYPLAGTLATQGRSEIAIWFGTMLGAVAAYLPGYRFNQGNTCVAAARCTTSFELHHPLTSASFFVLISETSYRVR